MTKRTETLTKTMPSSNPYDLQVLTDQWNEWIDDLKCHIADKVRSTGCTVKDLWYDDASHLLRITLEKSGAGWAVWRGTTAPNPTALLEAAAALSKELALLADIAFTYLDTQGAMK